VRVAIAGETVVGCAASMPQPTQWFVDDLAFDDADGHEIGKTLFEAIAERPALACIAGLDGALSILASDGGIIVGTPSTTARPVYDPGGTVCVIDRSHGPDPAALLQMALEHSAGRGDALIAVVAGANDHELESVPADLGFERTVDVHQWP